MALFTREIFASISNKNRGIQTFSKVLNEARNEKKSDTTTSVFLSHSHHDKDLINESVAFFKGINVKVYVDWLDETMPEKTNGITASNIKNKIFYNDKFILLATNNAVSSKWCNWELGIGDTYKISKDKLLILPLADNKGHWSGNEYLQIYPRIEPITNGANSFYDTIFNVIYPDGTKKYLDVWLKS